MKKNDLVEGRVTGFRMPASGVMEAEGRRILVKGALPGQKVEARITKKRAKKTEGALTRIVEERDDFIPPSCSVNTRCGGCVFQTLPYEKELALKEDYIITLLDPVCPNGMKSEGIVPSPKRAGYRNKMEYSFGDDEPGGPLHLGMHERGRFYNIVNTEGCVLTDPDFEKIRAAVLDFFRESGETYYHKRTHEGFLRYLVVRKGEKTGEILVNLITSHDDRLNREAFVKRLTDLPLDGKITGILQGRQSSVADAVLPDENVLLYGSPVIHDRILDLVFEISPYSFFQVNTSGAESLYSVVRDFAGEKERGKIYDLYCGTGTITQLLSPHAGEVVGIELVEEAIEAAQKNAAVNGVENCTFIAGDVLDEAHKLGADADLIVLDPPRDGIHPKAMKKILDLNPEEYIYVSCKPESLARDLPFFRERGYEVTRIKIVDMFPRTGHVETVALLKKKEKIG